MPSGIKQAFASRLTDVDSVAREQLGTIRFEGNKVYKYVKFRNVTAAVAAGVGSLVAYRAALYGDHHVVADNTDADAAVSCAGATLAVITGAAGTDYFCWIQIKGLITLDTAITAGAAGSPFYLGSTDKTGAIMSAATQQKAGVSVNATTLVNLDCPF